jgi:hypothetical protein
MGMIDTATVTCAVCARESQQQRVRAVGQNGPPDLDLRPAEMARSTMQHWLQQCPACGFVAPRIDEADVQAAAIVQAGPYRALLAETTYPPLARRFLCRAMLLEETGDLHGAAEETLHAAWVADDARKPDLARSWRLDAVALFRQGPSPALEQRVRIVDILRRAGDFGGAAAQAGELERTNLPDPVDRVVAFERRLIAAGDIRAYTVASALPPPAARPHVAHRGASGVRVGRGGLFSALRRLFGRG